MAVAMVCPEPEKTTHGKVPKTKLLLETKTNFSGARLSQARTVLACSTDPALAVLAGTKALDAAYGEAKKTKQQLDRPTPTRKSKNSTETLGFSAMRLSQARTVARPFRHWAATCLSAL